METHHYVILGIVALALVILRRQIKKIIFGKNGVSLETHEKPAPGKIIAEGNTAKKGGVNIASTTGGDITAKNNTAATDVNITTGDGPKA